MENISQSAMMRMRHKFAQLSKPTSWDKQYIATPRPYWWKKSFASAINFTEHKNLYQDGTIVWATFVMANTALFENNDNEDYPALVIYNRDTTQDHQARKLSLAGDLVYKFSGKKTQDVPSNQKGLHKILSDQQCYTSEMDIPKEIATISGLTVNTVMVYRKHLPRNCIDFQHFPLLLHSKSSAVALLPSYYWDTRILG